jgi:hypothetical protein
MAGDSVRIRARRQPLEEARRREQCPADESTASLRSSDYVIQELLREPAAEFYLPCLESDKDQNACFKLGNLYVRKAEQTKETPTGEVINGGGHTQVQLAE